MFEDAGPLDVCAAVAGVWPREDKPVWELPLERWRATLDANLTATFLTARAFLGQLGDRPGALVLVGSTAGVFGEAGHADYAAAKSAILTGLLLSVKNEVVRRNPQVRVNAVAPGPVLFPHYYSEEQKQSAIDRTLLKRAGSPQDVVNAVVFLIENDYITGEIIHVDGGRHIL